MLSKDPKGQTRPLSCLKCTLFSFSLLSSLLEYIADWLEVAVCHSLAAFSKFEIWE